MIPIGRWENSGFRQQINVRRDALRCDGALALTRCARIWAAADGRAYVVPDDVKDLAVAVLAHRITLTPEATFDGATQESLIAQVLEDVPSPTIGS